MATPIEAASARMACALCAITDLVTVSNLDRQQCTFDVDPPDAMNAGKKFSDHGIQDHEMPFLIDRLARCCPEPTVRTAVEHFPAIPAATEIRPVVLQLEALLLGLPGWDGKCMSEACCQECGQ